MRGNIDRELDPPEICVSEEQLRNIFPHSGLSTSCDDGSRRPNAASAAAAAAPTELKVCRVCFADESEVDPAASLTPLQLRCCRLLNICPNINRMISPCDCTGSQKYVHLNCLNEWRNTASYLNLIRCPTCHYRYTVAQSRMHRALRDPNFLLAISLLSLFLASSALGYAALCLLSLCLRIDLQVFLFSVARYAPSVSHLVASHVLLSSALCGLWLLGGLFLAHHVYSELSRLAALGEDNRAPFIVQSLFLLSLVQFQYARLALIIGSALALRECYNQVGFVGAKIAARIGEIVLDRERGGGAGVGSANRSSRRDD